MTDRAPPHVVRPGPSRAARPAANTAGVRRNLFQSQLMGRRPTPTATGAGAGAGATRSASASASSASGETLRLDGIDVLTDEDETSEIVVRDKNGEFEVRDPPTPPLDDPATEEDGALDDAQENERERHRLAEAVRHHQVNHNRTHAQPEEVLEVLRASMRAQVAALAEDNWMYEPEEQART
ncbi:hypothetical protein DL766_006975 [Monosporascus sp. MC13-8B]|uniref:Uncharacterized protein n=1 Tax=Monosporascus cannonballus TaxID=155416 RepID=A0ABY0HCG7_9PEZI|nr:hypothetical protein DL763_006717 [Monosporascus cannonballus]RYO87367.1 hypothetical protein DL762_004297 [Monosporascus cannonballus]RYP25650.1 hypothetical protein DL766_006975 [Monosporascus sp. MC13-8B]